MLRQIISTNTTGARRLCDPKVVRQLLILQLSVADSSTHSVDLQAADKDIAGVDALARTLLTCAPAESVGWLGVYWAAIQKDGFGPKTSALLDQSFHFAPHEAWIQLIRAPLVLRSYDSLSPSLKIAVEQDFEDIFKAQLYPSAAQLFKRATIAGRQKLLDRTCAATDNERALFRHFVTEAGIGIIRHSCYPLEELPFMPRT